MPFVIAMSVVCVFPSASLIPTNASRTSTKTIALSVEKICFLLVSLLRTCRAVMQSMRTVFASWLDSIIVAPFAKKRLSPNSLWQPHGKPGPAILPSTPCPQTCNASWTLCVMTAKPKVEAETGTFWEFSVRSVIRSIRLLRPL